MTHPLLNELAKQGNTIEIAISRLGGDEALCLKFIKRFPNDTSYKLFLECLAENNTQEAIRNVHMLKGLSSTLGLSQIENISQRILNKLRSTHTDQLEDDVKELKIIYLKTTQLIASYE